MQTTQEDIRIFTKGTNIKGQDNKKCYTVKQRLFSSATGVMYLCISRGKKVALRISDKRSSLIDEINILQRLRKVRDQSLGPCLIDVDQWETNNGNSYTFYVVEYITGETIDRFIEQNDRHWLPLFVVKLLSQLDQLHKVGYIYGNFTPEQLIVTPALQICTMDLSSVTKIDCPVKVNSRFFDRSSWMLGSSIATPSYDLFAITMVVLHIFYRRPFPTTDRPVDQLMEKINELPIATPYKQCFLKAVFGKYNRATEMKTDFLQAIIRVEDQPIFSKKGQMYRNRSSLTETHGLFVLGLVYFLSGYVLF